MCIRDSACIVTKLRFAISQSALKYSMSCWISAWKQLLKTAEGNDMFSEFGRVGRDVELRFTPSGMAVAAIALAYEYGRKDQQTGKRPTQWVEVTMWGKTAEALSQYLTKGKQVFIEAKDVHIQTYDKNDGTQGFKLAAEFVGIKFAYDGHQQGQAPA